MKNIYYFISIFIFAIYSDSHGQGGQTGSNTYQGIGVSTSGIYNTCFGYYSGDVNGSGAGRNTFIGAYSGKKNTTGDSNTYLGVQSGYSNVTGSSNIMIGYFSGYYGNGVSSNVYIGNYSGRSNSSGSENTFIGTKSGYQSSGTGNVFLGYHAGYYESGSDKLYIHNSNSSTPLIWGDFGAEELAFNGSVSINTMNIPAGYELAVGGNIIAEQVVVDMETNWPDYVFEEDYELKSLDATNEFINQHGHLPDVPSANEVEQQGLNLGEMNAVLYQFSF